LHDQIKGEGIEVDGVGGVDGTYRGEKKCIQGFGGKTLRKETILKT
jgi:hypothetical protein